LIPDLNGDSKSILDVFTRNLNLASAEEIHEELAVVSRNISSHSGLQRLTILGGIRILDLY
jgi:energy-converting hydrogenase A subunit M